MMKLVKRKPPLTEAEILNDTRRRHSTLHEIDVQGVKAMTAFTLMIAIAAEHGLLKELDAARDALCALHDAAKLKFEAMP
jgi:hypothetical protein